MTSDTDPTSRSAGSEPPGLLLSRDLIFTTKVKGTAEALGRRVLVAGSVDVASSLIEQSRPRVIFVNLAAGDLVSSEALATYQRLAGRQTPLVAFGSHVDVQALAAAKAAGCDPVLPRSRFTAELPELLRRYLGASA